MNQPATKEARRRVAARVLIAVFGVGGIGAAAGIGIFGSAPGTPNSFAPCAEGGLCIACIQPSTPQCVILARCGGDPCPPEPVVGGPDPYAGVQGTLARGLRQSMTEGAITAFHTDVVTVVGGNVTGCATQVFLTEDQRAAWLTSVDASAGGSVIVDCRFATAPAAFKRAGASRRSTLAGLPLLTAAGETAPDATVPPLDAGPEPP